jgi:hypothetical protein
LEIGKIAIFRKTYKRKVIREGTRITEVRKMEPRVENYVDATCVASTGGTGGGIMEAY